MSENGVLRSDVQQNPGLSSERLRTPKHVHLLTLLLSRWATPSMEAGVGFHELAVAFSWSDMIPTRSA